MTKCEVDLYARISRDDLFYFGFVSRYVLLKQLDGLGFKLFLWGCIINPANFFLEKN